MVERNVYYWARHEIDLKETVSAQLTDHFTSLEHLVSWFKDQNNTWNSLQVIINGLGPEDAETMCLSLQSNGYEVPHYEVEVTPLEDAITIEWARDTGLTGEICTVLIDEFSTLSVLVKSLNDPDEGWPNLIGIRNLGEKRASNIYQSLIEKGFDVPPPPSHESKNVEVTEITHPLAEIVFVQALSAEKELDEIQSSMGQRLTEIEGEIGTLKDEHIRKEARLDEENKTRREEIEALITIAQLIQNAFSIADAHNIPLLEFLQKGTLEANPESSDIISTEASLD